MADLYAVWYIVAISVGVAFVLGFVYMFILKLCAGFMVWLSLVAIFLILAGSAAYLYLNLDNYDEQDTNYDYVKYGSYTLGGLAVLFVLIVLCLCNRIRLGIAIIQTTADFINANPLVFLVPVVFLFLIAIWIAIWVIQAIFIFSVGEIRPRDDISSISTVEWTKTTRYVFLYSLFGLFWINAFIIGCAQFILAAAGATWYFSFTSDTKGRGSLWTGVKWIFTYHLGSIAFGSCIIAIIQMIRFIFEYYRRQALKGTNNVVLKTLFCITSYLLWCLEKCIKFITKNAYIQVALTSKNFCTSAMNAFLLVVNNAARFGVLHTLGCIFMFLGKLFIICATGLICYALMVNWDKPAEAITSPYFPAIACCIVGYLIGSIFLSIFSFSTDTILQCFLLDEELASQGKSRPSGNRPPTMDGFVTEIEKKKDSKGCCC